jgi:hypothetical protein
LVDDQVSAVLFPDTIVVGFAASETVGGSIGALTVTVTDSSVLPSVFSHVNM